MGNMRKTVSCLLILTGSLIMMGLTSCYVEYEPANITIENQTDQVLVVSINDKNHVVTADNRTIVFTLGQPKYRVSVKNNQGESIFSKIYTHKEVHKPGFKLVIPPLENNGTISKNPSGD
jgi:hypothetical protein